MTACNRSSYHAEIRPPILVMLEKQKEPEDVTKSTGVGRGGRRANQTGRPKKIGPSQPPGEPFDARRVLELIAADPMASSLSRVSACRTLLASGGSAGGAAPEAEDATVAAALRLLSGGKR